MTDKKSRKEILSENLKKRREKRKSNRIGKKQSDQEEWSWPKSLSTILTKLFESIVLIYLIIAIAHCSMHRPVPVPW